MPYRTTKFHTVTAARARLDAQVFNLGSIVAVLVPVPLLMIWFGIAFFIYAANGHHPNPRVVHYTRRAAKRFWGVAGTLLIFGQPLASFINGLLHMGSGLMAHAPGWAAVWGLLALGVIPRALWDVFAARREVWTDTEVETKAVESHV
jgi:hypothetical protein